jgi:hypothetical protein
MTPKAEKTLFSGSSDPASFRAMDVDDIMGSPALVTEENWVAYAPRV